MRKDNKQLYELIMCNVSREVKKTINEAGYVEQRVKKDKIYTKYIVFYIVGYDTDSYMHPHAIGLNTEDEVIKHAYNVIDDDDWRFDYYERKNIINNSLIFLMKMFQNYMLGNLRNLR